MGTEESREYRAEARQFAKELAELKNLQTERFARTEGAQEELRREMADLKSMMTEMIAGQRRQQTNPSSGENRGRDQLANEYRDQEIREREQEGAARVPGPRTGIQESQYRPQVPIRVQEGPWRHQDQSWRPPEPMLRQPEMPYRIYENHFPVQEQFQGMSHQNPRYMRVECPGYDGSGSFRSWKYKCEQYFEYYQVPENQRIQTIFWQLSEEALEWHHAFMEDKKGMPISWDWYILHMGLRFDRSQLGDPMMQLKELQQKGTVDEYQREFEKIRNQTQCSEAQALSMFLGGLKKKLQKLVFTHHPMSVLHAYNLAKLHEEALAVDGPGQQRFFSAGMANRGVTAGGYTQRSSLEKGQMQAGKGQQGMQAVKNKNYKTMSNTEFEEKRKNNLCYFCDEKYTAGHRCDRRKNFSLEIHLVEEEEPEEFVEELEEDITMYAINGIPVHSTFKMEGVIKGRTVLILLDSGSTHNVVSEKVVEELQIPTEKTATYAVTLADGKQIRSSMQCRKVRWEAGIHKFEIDALVLPLKDYDLILGMQWLETNEEMTWNFRQRSLQFYKKGEQITLQMLPKPTMKWITGEQLVAGVEKDRERGENQYFLVQLCCGENKGLIRYKTPV